MQRLALGSTMEPNSNEGALSINKTGMGSTRWLQVLVCVAQPDGVRDSTDETGVLAFGWTRNDDKIEPIPCPRMDCVMGNHTILPDPIQFLPRATGALTGPAMIGICFCVGYLPMFNLNIS